VTWTKRTGWAKLEGDSTFTLASDTVVISVPGTYLVCVSLCTNYTESFQARVTLNGASARYTNVGFFPTDVSGEVRAFFPISTTSTTDVLTVEYMCTRTQATDGLGKAVAPVTTTQQFAELVITRIG
jgi:hypothetical protein